MCFQLQNSSSWLTFLESSRFLKVLNAVGSNQQEFPFPSQLFQLFHLTYLALIGSFNIPSDISKLVNLQTLIIHPTFGRQRKRNLREYENASHFSLPLEIWRMRQLRHLLLYDLYTLPHPPESDGSDLLPLENLQTLSLIENLVWNEKMVQMIPNAKKLGLVYSIDQEYHLHHLKYLLQLQKLQVTGYQQFSWQGQNRAFPTTLKKLSLVGGGFPWEDMTILGSLPNLQVLKLLNYACNGETWETEDEEFPELEYLQIDRSHLKQWITQSSPFPRLQSLVLRSCWRLGEIPEAIGESTALEFIEVEGYCRSTLLESVEQIKEYQWSCGNDAFQVKVDPRDRCLRLSAHIAIQFYDLQDHLGYDRPSKVVDWLIKKAKTSIDELAHLPAWYPASTVTSDAAEAQDSDFKHSDLLNSNIPGPSTKRAATMAGDNDEEQEQQLHHRSISHNPNSQISSFLPPSMDSDAIADTVKSFFPIDASREASSSAMQFHSFSSSDLTSRSSSHI